jgi:hypothetical protein|nr:DUF4358 domain-containing protein [uncultured Faecalimonas sp.]
MTRKIHSRERRNGLDIIFIAQMMLLGILVVYVAVLLLRKGESDTPFTEMKQAVETSMDGSGMQEADHKMLRRNYQLNANDYDGVMLWFREGTMEVDEVLLVKLKSEEQSDAVTEAIEARRDSRKESFQGYGASQTKLIEDSIIDVRGNYILFVIKEDAEKIDQAFQKAL